jgi:hypothetical protein
MEFTLTKNHDEIRTWIREHGGEPSIKNKRPSDRGVIDVCFDEYDDEHQIISWEEFFDTFDSMNMEFRYECHDQECREFAYSFLPFVEAQKEIEDNDLNKNDMPEDVPVENIIPDA